MKDKYSQRRMPAEWESTQGILIAMPGAHTDWAYILEEALEQYHRLILAFTKSGYHCVIITNDEAGNRELLKDCDESMMTFLKMPYNDTWTRDYGPIAVERDERMRAIDFGFNGWGLKFASDHDNLVNLHMKEMHVILPDTYRNRRDFILEGGSIESDGNGTLLTTSKCLQSPNRNGGKTKKELNAMLASELGADHVLWLDYGSLMGDDTDSHIDTLCRIAPDNSIFFTGCRDTDDPQFEELLHMRAQLTLMRNKEGEPYNLIELPLPDAIYDENGERLPATYANYLVTPTHIFMPVYNQPAKDRMACMTVSIAFPNHEVVPVDCTTLIKQHGSLHCATMQLPDGLFNDIIFDKI